MKAIFEKKVIEISEAEARKVRIIGSPAYEAFQNILKENRGFSVVVVVNKRKLARNSRLTLDDMRRYISFHDDENNSIMKEFEIKCNAKANGELRNNCFFKIKKWFFEKFPEVA